VIIAVAAAFLLVHAQARLHLLTADRTVDSYTYYFAAKALARGENPYDTEALQAGAPPEAGFVFPYLYPPLVALLWRPLTPLGPESAHAAVVAGSTLLAVVNLALLWRLVRPPAYAGAWLLAFVALHAVCGPLVSTVRLGQINVALGTLVFGALLCERSDRSAGAGFLLALAILVKVTPFVFLVDLLVRGRWRTIAWCAASALALVASTIPVIGVGPWTAFFDRAFTPLPFNPPISLKGILDALGRAWAIPRGIQLGLVLAGLSVLLWRLLRRLPALGSETRDPVPAWAMLALVSLLAFPLTWHHHYYLALLPFGYFLPRAFERGGRHRWLWTAAALAALLRYPGALHPLKPLAALVAYFAI
jgi:hypothetical protein